MGLGEHLQRLMIDRLRGSGGGRDLNHSQEERHSHPRRQGNMRPCEVGCLPGVGSRDWLVGKSYLWDAYKGASSAKLKKMEQIWCGQS